MAKLYEMDLSSPIFKKSCDFEKRADFFGLFLCYTGSMQRTLTRTQGFYSSFHLRPANVQPGQPGAELPARPAGSEAPGNLGFMRQNDSRRTHGRIARRAHGARYKAATGRRRYYLARTGSGAVKARSVPARKPKIFSHFATSSAVNARRSPKTSPIFSFCVHSSTGRAPTFQAGDVGSRPAARSNKRTNAWKSKHGGFPT